MERLSSAIMAAFLRNRRAARSPILLYRYGLGWLLGSRLMLLEHTGRRSGLPRLVCIEVAERPARDVLVAASGFGRSAQWYRNLEADPRCRVSSGTIRRRPATARLLSAADSAAALARYKTLHPMSWKPLRQVLVDDFGQDADSVPMVEFHLH